ncbi:MAG: oxidoreductase [Oscillospiraceae bacterium]|nr:oxidoreductase [Oscillospiraceae bacterium]
MAEALFTTVSELSKRENLKQGERAVQSCHLHFNGPGASGFGVKRTAMLLPESAMLLVAPPCCGRHGTITGSKTGFEDRIFYLQMNERDLNTGAYLKRIPEAAELIVKRNKFKAILLCMTCVDAMLGTDLERISRKIQDKVGLPVVACYMDPISREGKQAPMVSVQRSIMGCLEPSTIEDNYVNLLGNFVPLDKSSELYALLKDKGIDHLSQISACETFDEYQKMAKAKLGIVIHPQAEASARDMEKKLGIPYVKLNNVYGPERMAEQYEKLAHALGVGFDTAEYKARAENAIADFAARHKGKSFAIGEAANGNSLEIAETFIENGIGVSFVLKNIVTAYDMEIIQRLNKLQPDLKVYSGVHPSMRGAEFPKTDVAVGLDAGYFLPEAVSVSWSMEYQNFGFENLVGLLGEIDRRIEKPIAHKEQMHGSYLTV